MADRSERRIRLDPPPPVADGQQRPDQGLRARAATALRSRRRALSTTTDEMTADGRSQKRYRLATLAGLSGIVSRVANIVALAVSVSVVVRRTSPEEFGLWIFLVTAVTLVGFADFGIGNGLINVVTYAQGRGDTPTMQSAISSAFFVLAGLAAILGLASAIAIPVVDWTGLLNVTEGGIGTDAAVATFVVVTLVSLPLGVSYRVTLALQEGWRANLWLTFGTLASLVLVVVAAVTGAPVPVLVGASLISMPLAYLGNSVQLFWSTRPELRPHVRHASGEASRQILGQGAMFFVLAVAMAVGFHSDSAVISHYLGVEAVADFAVPFRLFSIAPIVVGLMTAGLWPAYGDALGHGDVAWIRRSLRRSLRTAVLVTTASGLLLLVASRPLLRAWVGDDVELEVSLLLGLAAWSVVQGISAPLGAFLNGVGLISIQTIGAIVMAISNLALSMWLVQAVGVSGPIWATVITQSTCILLPAVLVLRGLRRTDHSPEAFTAWLHRWGGRPREVTVEARDRPG